MHVCICLRNLNSYERMKGRMNVWKYVCNLEDVKRGSELSFFIDQILVSDRTDIHTYKHTYRRHKYIAGIPTYKYYTWNLPLFGANASNSSKNIMQGFPHDRARKNKSRTAFSLAPIYLFRSSGPMFDVKYFRENRKNKMKKLYKMKH